MKKLTSYINESFEFINENKRDMLNIKTFKLKYFSYGTDLRDFEFSLLSESSNPKEILNIEKVQNISEYKFGDYKVLADGAWKKADMGSDRIEPNGWNFRIIGSQKFQAPFIGIYTAPNKVVYFYLIRLTQKKIDADKKARTEKINKPWLKKWVKEMFDLGLLEYKRAYNYTDDYAWDNANNNGKTDWLLVTDKRALNRILGDIDAPAYTVRGMKADPHYDVFSSWESYDLRRKEVKED